MNVKRRTTFDITAQYVCPSCGAEENEFTVECDPPDRSVGLNGIGIAGFEDNVPCWDCGKIPAWEVFDKAAEQAVEEWEPPTKYDRPEDDDF